MQMDYIGNIPSSLFDEQDVIVHDGVPIVTRRWGQPAKKVNRSRLEPSSSIRIQDYAGLKARLLCRTKAIFLAQSLWEIVPVRIVPFAGDLTITVIEFGVSLSSFVLRVRDGPW